MRLPSLQIGDLVAKLPIIQGGMGVGVSLSRLASAVANSGGIGVISGVNIGFREPDYETNTLAANIRAMKDEIKKARESSPDGILGVNILTAVNNYKELVVAAVESGIDLIISGAGLPIDLPKFVEECKTKVEECKTKIVPIVSSSKAASVIMRMWEKKYNRLPDAIIVEGPEAGGHLGFSNESLVNNTFQNLSEILKDVLQVVTTFEEKHNIKIPVIAAGGVFSGQDIAKYINEGAAGVQMATRFVGTTECDADEKFKNAYVNSKKEDMVIIKSPVGMPGRAIKNEFVKRVEVGPIKIEKCQKCLKTCNPGKTPYCISKALKDSVYGNADEGLVFAGSNAYRVNEIIPVQELIDDLVKEAETV